MFDFTKRDYASLQQEADSLLTEMLPEWTSRDDEDINWVTVKTICKLLSINNFYIDLAFNENNPYTVQLYKNALNMAKQKNMPIKKKTGARTEVLLFKDADPEPYTVVRGTSFPSPVGTFILENDVHFTANQTQATGIIVFGKFLTGTLPNTDSPFQSIKIAQPDIADRTIRIYVNGVRWEEQIDTLALSEENDEVYKQWLDDDLNYIIEFGDNKFGKIPVGEITYDAILLDLSSLGRLPPNNITKCSDSKITSVIQSFPAVGGNLDEDITSIKKRLQQWDLTQNRLVTAADALFLTKSVPGVSGAKITTDNLRYLVYVSTAGGTPSPELLASVLLFLEKRKIAILDIEVGPLVQREFACELTITLNNTASRNRIKSLFEEKLLELNNKGSLGTNIEILDLYEIISGVRNQNIGVTSGTVDKLHRTDESIGLRDIILEANESVVTDATKIVINMVGGL